MLSSQRKLCGLLVIVVIVELGIIEVKRWF